MWNKIDERDIVIYLMSVTGSTSDNIEKFLEFLSFLGYTEHDLINEAKTWNSLGDQERTDLAKRYAGIMYINRFYVLMDYLSDKEV